MFWPGSQVARHRSAKLIYTGAIPVLASVKDLTDDLTDVRCPDRRPMSVALSVAYTERSMNIPHDHKYNHKCCN